MKKCNFTKMQLNIENIVISAFKHIQINQILALNNP